jgi:protochlorophyllide reductase
VIQFITHDALLLLNPLPVITGASSGLGLNCAASLSKTGRHFIIMACRDIEKGKRAAKEMNMPDNSYVVMKLELGSLQSVRDFVFNLKAFKSARPVQNLVCNAAVYRPTDPEPAWTDDGFEASMGINHFGHFLLVNLLIDDMAKAKDARLCIVGSITGNTNTVGGGLVYPQADLGSLKGFELGAKKPIAMADGKPFFGAKAYKDAKVCNMMTVSELHRRYHASTGISFSSMYPGCIAETALFREKRPWFRKAFPWFMKYVTGGYVGMEEAGERLAQVVDDPQCAKSDVYWSWNGGAQQVGRWSPDGKPKVSDNSEDILLHYINSEVEQKKSIGCFEIIFAVYLSENKSMTKECRLMLLFLSARVRWPSHVFTAFAILFPITYSHSISFPTFNYSFLSIMLYIKGAGGSGGEIFENQQSDAVRDRKTAMKMWDLSVKACGLTSADLPKAKVVTTH